MNWGGGDRDFARNAAWATEIERMRRRPNFSNWIKWLEQCFIRNHNVIFAFPLAYKSYLNLFHMFIHIYKYIRMSVSVCVDAFTFNSMEMIIFSFLSLFIFSSVLYSQMKWMFEMRNKRRTKNQVAKEKDDFVRWVDLSVVLNEPRWW